MAVPISLSAAARGAVSTSIVFPSPRRASRASPALVEAVNAIGANPADLVAILEALKEAGALKAELVVL